MIDVRIASFVTVSHNDSFRLAEIVDAKLNNSWVLYSYYQIGNTHFATMFLQNPKPKPV